MHDCSDLRNKTDSSPFLTLENTIIILLFPPKCCITIVFSFSWDLESSQKKPQVAQAHYESREQHYPTLLINYSYSKKIIRRCMEKYSLLTKLTKCTLNIALKLTFSVYLFFFVFWLHFRPPRHCLRPFLGRQFFTQMTVESTGSPSSLWEPWTTLSYLAN